jgi:ligand-binding sensor domain-containing protein
MINKYIKDMHLKQLSFSSLLFCTLLSLYSCQGQKSNSSKNITAPGTSVTDLEPGIMAIHQDQKKNYWFGGKEKGVYKYDGKTLTLFTTQDGLVSNSILGIQEDKKGNLFFDTSEGVSQFDGQKFSTLKIVQNDDSKQDWRLYPEDLWFRKGWNAKGPLRFDGTSLYQLTFPKSNQEEEFYAKFPNSSYNPYGIYNIYKDRRGVIWFGTASLGLCRYDGESVSWLFEKQLTETPAGGDFGIRSIIEDQEGYFWFCNTRYKYNISSEDTLINGINRLKYEREDGAQQGSISGQENIPYFLSMTEDKQGNLWMVTYDEGAWQKKGNELIQYQVKGDVNPVLLFAIHIDHQGVIWLGSHNAGVYRFNGEDFEKFGL